MLMEIYYIIGNVLHHRFYEVRPHLMNKDAHGIIETINPDSIVSVDFEEEEYEHY